MAVLKSMNPDGVSDQQIKVVDIGKSSALTPITCCPPATSTRC
jgi:hypothetical protein